MKKFQCRSSDDSFVQRGMVLEKKEMKIAALMIVGGTAGFTLVLFIASLIINPEVASVCAKNIMRAIGM